LYATCEERLGTVAFIEQDGREDRVILICNPVVSVDAAEIVLDEIIGRSGWRRRPRTVAADAGDRRN
jgi:hypothetical protein